MSNQRPIPAEKPKKQYSHITLQDLKSVPVVIKDYDINDIEAYTDCFKITGVDESFLLQFAENWVNSKCYFLNEPPVEKHITDLSIKGEIKSVVKLNKPNLEEYLSINKSFDLPIYLKYRVEKKQNETTITLIKIIYYKKIY